ncbi:MAG: putative Nudix hydrolase NudL [Candidatus Celerinatantimonas neptuna]|nr:MAG: putative Nudix hydrolase NudL [Candidatus Celerinatantimonas neptuna]
MTENWLSHLLLNPMTSHSSQFHEAGERISAAVLLPVYYDGQKWQLMMIRRSLKLRHHAGQIAFPGGCVEPGDPNLKTTALRETDEEIGIKPSQVQVVTQLSNQLAGDRFIMTPFVGIVTSDLKLCANHDEVDEIIHIPFQPLLMPENYQHMQIFRHQQTHLIHFIEINKKVIWGATASVLYRLAKLMPNDSVSQNY